MTDDAALAWCMRHRANVWFSPFGDKGKVVVRAGELHAHGDTLALAVHTLNVKMVRAEYAQPKSSGHEIRVRFEDDVMVGYVLIWRWKTIRYVRHADRASAERFAAKHGIVIP